MPKVTLDKFNWIKNGNDMWSAHGYGFYITWFAHSIMTPKIFNNVCIRYPAIHLSYSTAMRSPSNTIEWLTEKLDYMQDEIKIIEHAKKNNIREINRLLGEKRAPV